MHPGCDDCAAAGPSPLHPGEVLREEFLVQEKNGITADTALRLSKYFGTTPEFWMNLQNRYELETAKAEIGSDLEEIETRAAR